MVEFDGNQAPPGNYTAAVCFGYPGIGQCTYVALEVSPPEPANLIAYGVYSGVAIAAAAILLELRRELRRSRARGPRLQVFLLGRL